MYLFACLFILVSGLFEKSMQAIPGLPSLAYVSAEVFKSVEKGVSQYICVLSHQLMLIILCPSIKIYCTIWDS